MIIHNTYNTYFASSHLIPPTFTTTGISPPATTGSDDNDFPGQEEGREVSFEKILIIITIIIMTTMMMMMVIKMMVMMMVVMMMVIITSFSPFLTGPLWCRPRVALPDDDNGHRYHHDHHHHHHHEHYNHSMMEQ